ncbi:MAG: hypothetical protein AAF810_09515 [Cyanobacteria bacterium P01_D01_bin.36]
MKSSPDKGDSQLMSNEGFDAGQWSHWLLVISFVSIASYGLWLSWQWKPKRYQKKSTRHHVQ